MKRRWIEQHCGLCGGDGAMPWGTYDPRVADRDEDGERRAPTCPDCGGRGLVRVLYCQAGGEPQPAPGLTREQQEAVAVLRATACVALQQDIVAQRLRIRAAIDSVSSLLDATPDPAT